MVVNLLKEEGIPAWSDASPATNVFGGLPFEPGHAIFVPGVDGAEGARDPEPLSPLQEPSERPRTRALRRRDHGDSCTGRDGERPVRVCYVVSYFHPFASGRNGRRWPRASSWPAAATRARRHARRPGLPDRRRRVQGIFIHRWIKTAASGPLFGLSFVAGVIAALCRLRGRDRRGPHSPGALGSRGDRAGAACAGRHADAGPAGQRGLLRRGRRAASAPAGPGCSAARSWPIRPSRRSRPRSSGSGATLGVAPERRMVRMASGVDAERVPARGQARSRRRLLPRPASDVHRPAPSPEEPAALARSLDRGRRDGRRPT